MMRAGRFGGSSRLQGRTSTGGRFGGSSSFGAQDGNGLRIAGPVIAFLTSAQPYTVTGTSKISVSDSTGAGGTYGIVISINSGVISLSGITGLSFSVGDGTSDATMTFTGSLANINTALDGLIVNSATTGIRAISVTFSHAATTRTTAKSITTIVGVVVANSAVPVISGSTNYGGVLTCSEGTWTGTPAPTISYQWQKNGTNISGQTASTYTSVFGDVGATITCEVTGTNVFNSVMAEATGVVILDPDAPVPVLTLVEDGLEEASPFYSFSSSAAGTLTWDFHSSATPPAAGAGDHLTGTQAIGSGITVWDTDLSSAAGETGYIHYRVTNSAGTSNILTSQVITVPAAGWLPTDLGADLLAWFDASDSGSLTLSGADVTQWNDLSGNGYHVSQGTATRYPQYSATSFNTSYPGLTFDGSNDGLINASFYSMASATVLWAFVVARLDSGAPNGARLVSYGTNATDSGLIAVAPLILQNGATEAVSSYRASYLSSRSITYGNNYRIGSVYDGANHTMYTNNVAGTPSASTDGFASATPHLYVGNTIETWANGWKGVICEIIVGKGTAPDSTLRTTIDDYLKAKWGL